MSARLTLLVATLLVLVAAPALAQTKPVSLQRIDPKCPAARPEPPPNAGNCADFHAVVFVHGIYGDATTFKNRDFDWPKSLKVDGRSIDVYRVNYQSAFLSWAKKNNPQFDDIADQFLKELAPLRGLNYRSIGFI